MKKPGSPEDDAAEKEDTGKPADTLAVPPSFYDKDIESFKKKFAKSLAERKKFKAHYAKTHNLTCLTRNSNIKPDNALIKSVMAGEER